MKRTPKYWQLLSPLPGFVVVVGVVGVVVTVVVGVVAVVEVVVMNLFSETKMHP